MYASHDSRSYRGPTVVPTYLPRDWEITNLIALIVRMRSGFPSQLAA